MIDALLRYSLLGRLRYTSEPKVRRVPVSNGGSASAAAVENKRSKALEATAAAATQRQISRGEGKLDTPSEPNEAESQPETRHAAEAAVRTLRIYSK